MAGERAQALTYLEVLDRVLDKGIVVDGWAQFSLGGIDLMTVDARVVVASVQTYLERNHEMEMAGLIPASGDNQAVYRIKFPL